MRIDTLNFHTQYDECMKIENGSFSNSDNTKFGKIIISDNVISLEAFINQVPYDYMETFAADKSVSLNISFEKKFKAVANEHTYPFWSRPIFFDDFTKSGNNMQAVLIKNVDECICFIALATENSICTFSKSSLENVLLLNVKAMYGGVNSLKCDAAVYACDKNPVNAIKKAYRIANNKGYISGGLRESKDYPEYFNYLGWCSWNCCYHDVTYDKIISKAKEFKEKKIPAATRVAECKSALTGSFASIASCNQV